MEDAHRPANPAPEADVLRARLLALEESHAFLERKVEQLDAELAASTRRLSEIASRLARLELEPMSAPPVAAPAPDVLTLAQAERQAIARALSEAESDLDRAAALLGTDRGTLEQKLLRQGLA